jgi:arsenate reductase
MEKVYNVLFICTGNSARSILSEGLLNDMAKGRFRAFSAGSHPKGTVHPLALQELAHPGVLAQDFGSKSWEEFAVPDAPQMDFVFTVCDQAAVTIKRRLELMLALPLQSLATLAIEREIKSIGKL